MKTTIYLMMFIASVFVSCGKSVISDIEVQDPSLIKMEVHISQHSDNKKFVYIRPQDKKSRVIELKNGIVNINGQAVDYNNSILNGFLRGYRYQAKEGENNFTVTVRYNSNNSYTFKYGLNEGFPEFGTAEVIIKYPDRENYVNTDTYYITKKDIPFRDAKIKVYYNVYKKIGDMK